MVYELRKIKTISNISNLCCNIDSLVPILNSRNRILPTQITILLDVTDCKQDMNHNFIQP